MVEHQKLKRAVPLQEFIECLVDGTSNSEGQEDEHDAMPDLETSDGKRRTCHVQEWYRYLTVPN